jgi:hypothetical protein
VELAGGEVRELVAEDFVEKAVGRLGDVGGDADEAEVGVAPAEGAGEAGGELDAGSVGEAGRVPGVDQRSRVVRVSSVSVKSSGTHGRLTHHMGDQGPASRTTRRTYRV